jgi:hypothetical protein
VLVLSAAVLVLVLGRRIVRCVRAIPSDSIGAQGQWSVTRDDYTTQSIECR